FSGQARYFRSGYPCVQKGNETMSIRKRRRTFSAAFKAEVVLQWLSGAKTQAELCREHELAPQLLQQWKQTFLKNASAAFQSDEPTGAEAARIAQLERALGRATLENDILKKASSLLSRTTGGDW